MAEGTGVASRVIFEAASVSSFVGVGDASRIVFEVPIAATVGPYPEDTLYPDLPPDGPWPGGDDGVDRVSMGIASALMVGA